MDLIILGDFSRGLDRCDVHHPGCSLILQFHILCYSHHCKKMENRFIIHNLILSKIGTFFMINLCLVVIANQFSETRRRETAKMKAEREEFSSDSSLSSFSDRSFS